MGRTLQAVDYWVVTAWQPGGWMDLDCVSCARHSIQYCPHCFAQPATVICISSYVSYTIYISRVIPSGAYCILYIISIRLYLRDHLKIKQ